MASPLRGYKTGGLEEAPDFYRSAETGDHGRPRRGETRALPLTRRPCKVLGPQISVKHFHSPWTLEETHVLSARGAMGSAPGAVDQVSDCCSPAYNARTARVNDCLAINVTQNAPVPNGLVFFFCIIVQFKTKNETTSSS